jgi:putative flippase GtrA
MKAGASASASVRGDAPTARVDPAPRPSSLLLFGRHQLASVAATAVDYAVMIVCVSLAGLGPVAGTILGASSGAITNFALGRYFTFRADGDTMFGQAFRYGLVSAMSLVWNATGEHLLAVMLGIQYIIARLIVGTLVGFVWNFPMHRYFVFKK